MRTFALAAFATALSLYAGAAAADPTFRLHFTQGSACASPAAIAAQFQKRGLRVAENADADVEISVVVTDPGYDAQMTVRAPNQPETHRDTSAATCDDIYQTFAFALALATESINHPTSTSTSNSNSTPPSSDGGTPPNPRLSSESAPLPPPRTSTPTPTSNSTPTPTPTPPGRVVVAVDAFGGFVSGAAPSLSPVFGGNAEIEYLREYQIFSPMLRVGGFGALPTTDQPSVHTRYGLQSSRVDACPVIFFEAVRPCLRVEVGRIQLKEFDVPGAALVNDLWATTELALLLRWSPFKPLFVQLEGAVGVALSQATLNFAGVDLFSVPTIVGGGEIGAGVHFW